MSVALKKKKDQTFNLFQHLGRDKQQLLFSARPPPEWGNIPITPEVRLSDTSVAWRGKKGLLQTEIRAGKPPDFQLTSLPPHHRTHINLYTFASACSPLRSWTSCLWRNKLEPGAWLDFVYDILLGVGVGGDQPSRNVPSLQRSPGRRRCPGPPGDGCYWG